jgi:hypothetical protein
MQEAIKLMGQHIGRLAVEERMTLPIPQVIGGQVLVHRLVYNARPTPDGLIISPPQMIVTVDLKKGGFVSYRRLAQQEYPVPAANDAVPRFEPPNFSDPAQLLATYERLYELYDALLPAYLEGRKQIADTTRKSAREFRGLFDRMAEPPLHAYYNSLGGEFFAWTESAAR